MTWQELAILLLAIRWGGLYGGGDAAICLSSRLGGHHTLRRMLLVLYVTVEASLRRETIRKISINAVQTFNSVGKIKETKVKGREAKTQGG